MEQGRELSRVQATRAGTSVATARLARSGLRGRDKRWRPRRVPPRSTATRWRNSAWSAPALTMGVCGAFTLLAPLMLSLKAMLTFAWLCERLPAAKATLKERADAEASKLSVKPALPWIRVAIDVSGWLHRLAAFSSSAEEVARRVVDNCKKLQTLRCNVTVVFDGETNSPCRGGTRTARPL